MLGWSIAASAEISVRDDFNRLVTLSEPAQRILSLAPHNTENLFSAGAGDRIVGVVEYSNYPAAAKEIQRVGSHARINVEAVIALDPDLVVAWQTGANRESLKKLLKLGYPIYYSEPRTFEDIIENIEELARLAGTGDRIDPPISTLRAELTDVKNRFGNQPVKTVFYQVWSDPLMTLNGDHFISRVLESCGARNAFSDLPIIAPRISVEAVVQADPDIIVSSRTGGLTPDMSMWKKWTSLNAVRHDYFIFVDADIMHRHTARMIMGIRDLCRQIDRIRQSD